MKNITKAKLYVAKKTSKACFQRFFEPLSVNKAKLYLQVIKTSFLLANGKFLLAKRKFLLAKRPL